MQGYLARLVAVEEADYELITRWVQPSHAGALGAGGDTEFYTLETIRAAMKKNPMAMIESRDGRKVGLVQWHTQRNARSYELGAMVGDPELWDSGCGAEASLLALDYLFRCKDAHRVQFMTGLYNRRVLSFLFKTDVVIEGILRDYFYFDGRYHDAVVASVLRPEYDALVAAGDDLLRAAEQVPVEEKELAAKEFRTQMRQRWERMFTELVERD
nr:GNAT family protein [Micromonospora sp. DSM 115978]